MAVVTLADRALAPAGRRRGLLSMPRAEPAAPQAAPDSPDPPCPASEPLHAVLVDPGPLALPRRSRRRSGLGLAAVVAAVVLADGAASVRFQPRRAPAPVTTDRAQPSADAAVEQAAVAPPPGAPAAAPAPIPEPVAITPEPSVTALMQRALDVEAEDPAEAAVAYARAAIRGRARAAYYLGQLYETGLGIEPNPGMARLWYAAAADLPSARRRLEAASAADAPLAAPAPPVPIFQARLDTGASEMIWRVSDVVMPVRFRVEALGPREEPLPAQETTVPGLVVPFPVSTWRVIAIGADGTESAPSAMVRMIPGGE